MTEDDDDDAEYSDDELLRDIAPDKYWSGAFAGHEDRIAAHAARIREGMITNDAASAEAERAERERRQRENREKRLRDAAAERQRKAAMRAEHEREHVARVKELLAQGMMVKDIAAELGISAQKVCVYSQRSIS